MRLARSPHFGRGSACSGEFCGGITPKSGASTPQGWASACQPDKMSDMSDINQDTTSAQKLGSTSSGPMPSASPNALAEQIRSAFHEWALFIDLDGTLIEIAAAPDQVQVPPDLGVLLRALELRTGGALAIITGRPVDFVDGLFPEHAFTIAGVHGAEIRFGVALGQEDRASRVQTPSHHRLAKARDFVRDQTLPLRGLLLEDKGSHLRCTIAASLTWKPRSRA